MRKIFPVIKFICFCIIVETFLFGFYYITSIGIADKTFYLQMRRYIPCSIAVVSSIYLWRLSKLKFKKIFPHALVGLFWILVYPLCYWFTFHKNTNFIDNHYDIAFGAYIFACTVCFHLLLFKYITPKYNKFITIIISIIHFILTLIPLSQIIYYIIYQSPFTEAGWIAIIQTNSSEAKEYLLSTLGYFGILIVLSTLLLFYLIFYILNYSSATTIHPFNTKIIILTFIILISTICYLQKMFIDTGVMNKFHNAHSYFTLNEKFQNYHKSNFKNLKVIPSKPMFSQPSTIIMIIGESASRDFMSAYTNTSNDTTPWMRTMSLQSNCILFKNAYSSWIQTVPALERALTEKNQYNSIEFNQSITLLDIAKKAGYTTYWFSNQGIMGGADTPITMVAKTADHYAWIEETLANTDHMRYDGDLLPYLTTIDPSKNNFVVLHLMGSHDNFINRYPPEFTKFGIPNEFDLAINYDNSIAYTDWLLEEVYDYGNRNLNLQALLYFSDYGADPLYKRHPDRSSFSGYRIPLFLYLSKEYESLYPQTSSVLKKHKDSYFTNDLVYDMVCGILNIESPNYDNSQSIASPKYKFTRETLRTGLGKIPLTSDKTDQ